MYNFIKISVYVHFSAGEGGTGNAKLLQDSCREDWLAVAPNVFERRDEESLFVACPAGAELLRRLHQLCIEFRHEVLQRRPFAVDGDPDAPEKEQQTGQFVLHTVKLPAEAPGELSLVERQEVRNRPPFAGTEQIHQKMQVYQPGEQQKTLPSVGRKAGENSGENHAVKKIVPVHVMGCPVRFRSLHIGDAVQVGQRRRQHGEKTLPRRQRETIGSAPAAHDMALYVHGSSSALRSPVQ